MISTKHYSIDHEVSTDKVPNSNYASLLDRKESLEFETSSNVKLPESTKVIQMISTETASL